MTAEQITAIQHDMRLSDAQLCEALGFATESGMKRIQRWKQGGEKPSGPAAKMLLLLHKLDRAIKAADAGENMHVVLERVRDAVPDFLQ